MHIYRDCQVVNVVYKQGKSTVHIYLLNSRAGRAGEGAGVVLKKLPPGELSTVLPKARLNVHGFLRVTD